MEKELKEKIEELFRQVSETGKLPEGTEAYGIRTLNAAKAIKNSVQLNYGRGLEGEKLSDWKFSNDIKANLGIVSWCPECESIKENVNFYSDNTAVPGWYCEKCAPKNTEPVSRHNMVHMKEHYGNLFKSMVRISEGSYKSLKRV